MALQRGLQGVRAGADLGRHHGGDARRPCDPGVPLLARQAEHQRRRAGPVCHLAAPLLQLLAGEMRHRDLARGARLDEVDAAARQPLLARGLAHGRFRRRTRA